MTIDFESLRERLKEMFPNQYKSDVEQYIESKNPKSPADVEHYIQQYKWQQTPPFRTLREVEEGREGRGVEERGGGGRQKGRENL